MPHVDADELCPLGLTPARLRRATWAFVALGAALRVARYLMDYPLWWDEAFVAVNFLRRGYLDLLRPLDYGQVCPVLFLWAELTAVKLLGFSEWSLRLVPLACSVASMFMFRAAAGLVLRGIPLLIAVAIFAVSFHPIRHAADVKPYAGDLLAAIGLLTLALAWLRRPERSGPLWALAAVAPIALAGSNPAVFVAGGIGLGLARAVARSNSKRVWIAYAAFLISTLATFIGLYVAITSAQSAATLATMQAQWGKAFPPLDSTWNLARWLVAVHTGSMFAYPCGGDDGASVLTFGLFVVGAIVLCRRGRGTVAGVCLAPFALAIAASALRRYPYGGVAHGSPARVMQYLVPAICLLTAVGASAALGRVSDHRRRLRVLRLGLLGLVVVGIAPIVADGSHPYRAVQAQRARQFARGFWPELSRNADPVCLRWDFGVGEWDSTNLNVAVYLCNQRIYSPARRSPQSQNDPVDRPLRCVLSLSEPDERMVRERLGRRINGYRLTERRVLDVNMGGSASRPRVERYVVYEFAPEASARIESRSGPRRR